ncbi:MAG: DUF6273 domain-containing protein [Ruthenibacterium sp.]
MGQLLSNLANGSLVKLNENTKATKFIKLDNDHYGAGTGVTLIRKDAFRMTQWDTSDSTTRNVYIGCYLDNFCDCMWPQKLDDAIRACIIPVPVVVGEGNAVATLHTLYRKAFALSCTEVGAVGWQTDGTLFSYFSDNTKRIAYLDETATAVDWGLRAPYSDTIRAYYVCTDGTAYYNAVCDAHFAPRPAFNLKSSILVSNTTDGDGCYTVESVPSNGGMYVKNGGVWVKV